ncbi:UNVERIFIED_ORG: hypothetical protein J2W87_005898 [Pseudomonas putida]|nr:hypothetical protein [Pseudomonas putida]
MLRIFRYEAFSLSAAQIARFSHSLFWRVFCARVSGKKILHTAWETVGASLLAMDSRAPRLSSLPASSLTIIAGKPAPTGGHAHAEIVGASLLAMDSSAPRLTSLPELSLATIAGKPAPTRGHAHAETVGASLLAMDSRAPRLTRSPAFSLTTIASKLAPTRVVPMLRPVK